jgi:filamentous hemagglutinin
MPADSVSPFTRYAGPAIDMEEVDHFLTSSHGRRGAEGVVYRAEIKRLIDNGQIRAAMAREIWDARRAAAETGGSPSKYKDAIREMLNYAHRKGWLVK